MAVATRASGNTMPGPRRLYTDFQGNVSTSGRLGTAATGTAQDVNILTVGGHGNVPAVCFESVVQGTQTILGGVKAALGFDANSQDQTDNDGVELCPGILYRALGPATFKIGTDQAFYAKLKFLITDVSGTDDCAFGFRKIQAYGANFDDYTDFATLNVISGNIKIETALNNAATTTTDTTQDWADGETHTLAVYVSGAGVVTYQIDDAAPTVTAAFTFDDGDEVVPFFFLLNSSDIAGAVVLQEWDCGLQ